MSNINREIFNLLEKYKDKIVVRDSKDGRFKVVKYRREVFFKGEWDSFLREARGMVLDQNYNVVSLPFTKIHNYGVEKDAPEFADNEAVFSCRKINGFMVACTLHNGVLLWSTTGSVDSDYIGYAKDMYNRMSDASKDQFIESLRFWYTQTFMFECVHPNDPHIVEEEPGLYLLAVRAKRLGSDVVPWTAESSIAEEIKLPEVKLTTFGEVKKEVVDCKHEGFVIYSTDYSKATKIKSTHYLTKKALMRKNFDKIKTLDKSMVDEEFYPLIEWFTEFDDERRYFFEVLDEVARREYLEKWLKNKS
jgi:hypothetical protein